VRRQAAFAGADLDLSAADASGQLDDGARGAHELRAVAQVVADLALDGGTATARRSPPRAGSKRSTGLDEADGADLHEVVDGLASARIAARDRRTRPMCFSMRRARAS
jgi:hypothetical protein